MLPDTVDRIVIFDGAGALQIAIQLNDATRETSRLPILLYADPNRIVEAKMQRDQEMKIETNDKRSLNLVV